MECGRTTEETLKVKVGRVSYRGQATGRDWWSVGTLQSKRLKVKVCGVRPRYKGKLSEDFACPGNNFSIARIKDGLSVLGFRCKCFLLIFFVFGLVCVVCVCVCVLSLIHI